MMICLMKVLEQGMGIKTMKPDLFVNRMNGIVMLCNKNGQKMVVTDKNIMEKSDDEIIKHYQSRNIFKESNGRRC